MTTTDSTSEYLLLFRGNDWERSLSPADLQQTMSRFLAWFEHLSAEGIVLSGQPLAADARIVSGREGRVVADGPFTESKEAIGGYFLIRAASLDGAVTIAQQCPTLPHGGIVEVRPIAAECPTVHRARLHAVGNAAAAVA